MNPSPIGKERMQIEIVNTEFCRNQFQLFIHRFHPAGGNSRQLISPFPTGVFRRRGAK